MSENVVNVTQIEPQTVRRIDDIIVHCSATYPTMDVGAAEIRRVHTNENHWSDIGYHYVIRRNGVIEKGRSDAVPGAHCKGHNARSIGVCLVGGIEKTPSSATMASANFTPQQYKSLESLILALKEIYPSAELHGHSDYANKACPCFSVAGWWEGVVEGQR